MAGVAIVTGAGSGIGREVARALLGAGWALALAGRREETLAETASGSDNALVVPTNVSDAAAVEALFARACSEYGRVDLLFNNAGVFGTPAAVEDFSVEEWQAVVDTNLTGSFLCAREAFRGLPEQDPRGGR